MIRINQRKAIRTLGVILGVIVLTSPLWYFFGIYLGLFQEVLPRGKIVGRVTDLESGEPLGGVHIYAAPWWYTNPYVDNGYARTRADGSYALGELRAPEYYQVQAQTFLLNEPRGYESDAVEVHVLPAWRTRLDFAIDRTPPKVCQAQVLSNKSGSDSWRLRVVASDNLAISSVSLCHRLYRRGTWPLCTRFVGAEFSELSSHKEDALQRFHPPREVRYVGRHDNPWGPHRGRYGWLQVWACPDTEFSAAADTGHLLYETVAGDFDAVARLAATPREPGQESGLMVRQGPTHWLKVTYTCHEGHRQVVCTKKDGRGVTVLAATRCSANPLFLRVRREKDTFTSFFSTDGRQWKPQHQGSEALPEEVRVGLLLAAGASEGYQTDFDFLRFQKVTLAWKPKLELRGAPLPQQVRVTVGDPTGNGASREIKLPPVTPR